MVSGSTVKTKKKSALSVEFVISELKKHYPDSKCSLNFESPFQLICATILSAQCTDDRVNKVTPALFKKFPTAKHLAIAKQDEVESLIRTTGFFRAKAKSLIEMSKTLVEKHGGEVPNRLEDLVACRGVGRKTANVVLGNAFGHHKGIEFGMVVDTHVGRIVRRLGLTRETDPVKVEHAITKLVPRKDLAVFPHLLISHGRAICTARRAKCDECFLNEVCPKIGVG